MSLRLIFFPRLLLPDAFLFAIPLCYTRSLLYTKGEKAFPFPAPKEQTVPAQLPVSSSSSSPHPLSSSTVRSGTTQPEQNRQNLALRRKIPSIQGQKPAHSSTEATAPRGCSRAWGQPKEGAKFLLQPGRSLHGVTGGLRRTGGVIRWQ